MTMPERIQRKRTKGWRMPPNTVYVGRGSKWGNPYRAEKSKMGWKVIQDRGDYEMVRQTGLSKTEAVECCITYFESDCRRNWYDRSEIQEELRGKNLACWCPLDQPCHADVLLELANTWRDL